MERKRETRAGTPANQPMNRCGPLSKRFDGRVGQGAGPTAEQHVLQ